MRLKFFRYLWGLSLLVLVLASCDDIPVVQEGQELLSTVQGVATQVEGSGVVATAQAAATEFAESGAVSTAGAVVTEQAPAALETARAFTEDRGPDLLATARALLPDFPGRGAPADIPLVEGNRQEAFSNQEIVSYSVPQDFAGVLDFYRQQMLQEGWAPVESQTLLSDSAAVLYYEKAGQIAVVTISVNPMNNETIVLVTVQET